MKSEMYCTFTAAMNLSILEHDTDFYPLLKSKFAILKYVKNTLENRARMRQPQSKAKMNEPQHKFNGSNFFFHSRGWWSENMTATVHKPYGIWFNLRYIFYVHRPNDAVLPIQFV